MAKIAPFSTNDAGWVGYSSGNGIPASGADAPPSALGTVIRRSARCAASE